MPLLVSDYSWTQTASTVHISLPLKGARVGKVDIVSTDEYVKVHFPPYLFEAFLLEPVDDDRSTARVGDGVAVIGLEKRTARVWEQLMVTTADKEKKKEIRRRALLEHHNTLSSQARRTAETRQADRKYALETMMKLEQEERDGIQRTKDGERERTTAELQEWQRHREEEDSGMKKRRDEEDSGMKKRRDEEDSGMKKRRDEEDSGMKKRDQRGDLPPPRRSSSIFVSFTPRVFLTALRESRVPEEEEWLRKQAAARRAVSGDDEDLKDLKEEERNPEWLKDKGDQRFLTGDFLGAVNAYNLSIRLNRRNPAVFSNRAACHLKMRNLHKAIEDASQALDLLTPPVAANAAARLRASVRRGTAFLQLQLYAQGLQDFQAALKIDPQNEALQADTQRLRDIIQGSAAGGT
ncbi:dynein axonemal assembly factor 4 isoform X1 [Embiotoca jacksoni]|uniref:dynein axonemal assembly factor 4 isoform X1 n=1 Tax=Embiotoca jacksoni TaxID=100190 RepID=UPI0037047EAF